MGYKSYCTDGIDSQVGLASSIGGCGLKQIEHANAYATIARLGVYKPVSSVLEVRNAQGQVIKQWKDEGKQVIDPQVPYIIADILSDDTARSPSYGRNARGLVVPGVKTFTKTGTSNAGTKSKDLWMMSTSPRVATSIWVGNHDTRAMSNALSSIVGPTIDDIMEPLHKDVFQKDGTWKPGDWFTKPAGVQTLFVNGRNDLFPSWFNKNQQSSGKKMTFDRVSKKLASDCTPEAAKIEVTVQTFTDPITKKTSYISSEGYDASASDDAHKCDDLRPSVDTIASGSKKITATVTKGTFTLQTVEFKVDGVSIGSVTASGSDDYTIDYSGPTGSHVVEVIVTDQGYYQGSSKRTLTLSGGS